MNDLSQNSVDIFNEINQRARCTLTSDDEKNVLNHIRKKSPSLANSINRSLLARQGAFSSLGKEAINLFTTSIANNIQKASDTIQSIFPDARNFENLSLWLLFLALSESQQNFVQQYKVQKREEALSEGLLTQIRSTSRLWADRARNLLNDTPNNLEVAELDLQVQRREGITGGDFALILEIHEHSGSRFIPVIFQAKRFIGEKADISQHSDNTGFQFDVLKKSKCLSAYVFYENGEQKINENVPPIVKKVIDIPPQEERKSTTVYDKSLDFRTFILSIIFDNEIPVEADEKAALSSILESVEQDQLIKIIAIGNAQGMQSRYKKALADIRKTPTSGVKP